MFRYHHPDSMDKYLSKLQEIVKYRGAWHDAVHGVARVRHDSLTKHQQHQLYGNKQNTHMYAFVYGFFKKKV